MESNVSENPCKLVVNQRGESGVCITESSYTWVIKQFIEFSQPYCSNLVNIESPIIKLCNRDDSYEFKLQIFPSIVSANTNYGIHVVTLACPDSQAKATFMKLNILNSNGAEQNSKQTWAQLKKGNVCLSHHINGRQVIDNCLVDGDLTIKFEVIFCNGIYHNSDNAAVLEAASALSKMSILDKYEELLNSAKFSDVTIVVGEKKFPAHKNILATRSPVFSAMFDHDMLENKKNIVEISDVEPEIMAEVLRFIYADKVNNLKELAADLLVAADKYQLEALRLLCEEMLVKKLNIDNIVEILKIVDLCASCRRLRDSVLKFLTVNRSEVADLENFDKTFEALSPALLTEVTKTFMTMF